MRALAKEASATIPHNANQSATSPNSVYIEDENMYEDVGNTADEISANNGGNALFNIGDILMFWTGPLLPSLFSVLVCG